MNPEGHRGLSPSPRTEPSRAPCPTAAPLSPRAAEPHPVGPGVPGGPAPAAQHQGRGELRVLRCVHGVGARAGSCCALGGEGSQDPGATPLTRAVRAGECCIAMRSMIGSTAQQFETFLFHRGEETGSMRGWMKVRVPKERHSTRERLYGKAAPCHPAPATQCPSLRHPRGPGDISVPLQSGSALRRRTKLRQRTPRRAPSHLSGTPPALPCHAPHPQAVPSPAPQHLAGAGPTASRRPAATPTQPTSSSRGSPPPVGCRRRAPRGGNGPAAPSGHGCPRPVGSCSAPRARAGRNAPNRPSWRGMCQRWATAR